jgi:hypothetical protein
MKQDGLQRMLDFLDFLRDRGIHFTIEQKARENLTVTFTLVGARVEVDFDPDSMQFCVFKGSETVQTDEKVLHDLIRGHWDA